MTREGCLFLKKEFYVTIFMMQPIVTIVSPMYNEQEGLPEFVRQIHAVMGPLGLAYELVLVNDGSRDNTLAVATEIAAKDPFVRVVSFSRNFGHEAASTAGMRYARGECAVLIDSDLQDPPAVIPEMIKLWRQGNQIVYGVRSKRHEETALKKVTSWLFYRVMSAIAKIELPKDTGDFRLMDRKVIDAFNSLNERNRFVRGMICWVGYRSTGVPFIRAPRFAGKTKYNYVKLVRLAIDSITGFTTMPLKIATWLGLFVAFCAIMWMLVVIYQHFFFPSDYRPGGFTFMSIAILLLGGTQIFLIGLLGEYLARTYEEVQRRPLYIVDELINFSDTKAVGGPNGRLIVGG